MPLAIAANAVPIIAFAPIFDVWFNPLSPHSKMAIAGVLCFLPVMVNTLRGLQSASPRQIELMRSYACSDLEIWRRVRVPAALPFVFTALKVASVLAMIGAIVGEYFGGSFNVARRSDQLRREYLQLRARLGRHPRRLAARARALRSGRGHRAGGRQLGARVQGLVNGRESVENRGDANAGNRGGTRMRKRWLASVLLVGVLSVAAVVGASTRAQAAPKLTNITLQLKWVPQAQFAGYYAASLKGFYKDAGLNVTLKNGGPNIIPEQVVASGQAQFGVDWLPSLLAARDKGTDLVNVAQVFARSGMTQLTWKSSGINTIAKMKDKKVANWLGGNQYELFAALTKNGMEPRPEQGRDDRPAAVRHEPLPATIRSTRRRR